MVAVHRGVNGSGGGGGAGWCSIGLGFLFSEAFYDGRTSV